MKSKLLFSIFVILFCFAAAIAQKSETKLSIADQRRIIEVLLAEKFKRSGEKTLYISTANLPRAIQKNFPRPKNIKVRFVSDSRAAESKVCAYEFGTFEFIDKFVSVTFGNCREGLAYDFVKSDADWQAVGLVFTRQISY